MWVERKTTIYTFFLFDSSHSHKPYKYVQRFSHTIILDFTLSIFFQSDWRKKKLVTLMKLAEMNANLHTINHFRFRFNVCKNGDAWLPNHKFHPHIAWHRFWFCHHHEESRRLRAIFGMHLGNSNHANDSYWHDCFGHYVSFFMNWFRDSFFCIYMNQFFI